MPEEGLIERPDFDRIQREAGLEAADYMQLLTAVTEEDIRSLERLRRGLVPQGWAYHASNQTVSATSTADISLDSERFDTDGLHDTSTNNERVTIWTSGRYLILAALQRSGSGTAHGELVKNIGGSDTVIMEINTESSNRTLNSTVDDFLTGDYLRLRWVNDSSNTHTIENNGNIAPMLAVFRLGFSIK